VIAGQYVLLAVSDTGCGIDQAVQDQIFEPFFSTKGEKGTGLGLSTVYGIVKQHKGNIWVYSEPGHGTTFKTYLPVVEQESVKEESDKTTTTDLKGSETILLVEDDEQVRDITLSILKRQGYKVLETADPTEALAALDENGGPVDLLLTDVVMPEMNGKQIFKMVKEKCPGIKVLYMSGYTNNVIAHRGILDEGVHFIQKPFTVQALAVKLRELLDNGP
jgi:CheY-like chemotaxis protein